MLKPSQAAEKRVTRCQRLVAAASSTPSKAPIIATRLAVTTPADVADGMKISASRSPTDCTPSEGRSR